MYLYTAHRAAVYSRRCTCIYVYTLCPISSFPICLNTYYRVYVKQAGRSMLSNAKLPRRKLSDRGSYVRKTSSLYAAPCLYNPLFRSFFFSLSTVVSFSFFAREIFSSHGTYIAPSKIIIFYTREPAMLSRVHLKSLHLNFYMFTK